MSLFSGRKTRILSAAFLLSVGFLFFLSVGPAQAYHATSSYAKPSNGTLTSANWNDLFSDFVNTWLPTTMNGPLGIGTTIPPSSGLLVNGPINALNIYSTSNVGIGKTNPGSALDMIGSINTSGTVNGTGLCIAGICKTDWGDISGSGWTATGTLVYKTSTSGNVGIGITNPGQKLDISGVAQATSFNIATGANVLGLDGSFSRLYGLGGVKLSVYNTDHYVDGLTVQATTGNVGIGKTNPTSALDMVGSINTSGTVNGTGLCIAGVCKTDWSGVGATSGWTATGTLVYKTSTSGNVGIGTTDPSAAKLTVSGDISATGATLSGALVMNGGGTKQNISGVNKLTVDTIDPLYYIKGINYSSYASSIVGGVKEEYVGKIKLEKKNKVVQEFEASIDFSELTEGSELWLWRQVVDFNKDNVEVMMTPYGRFARTYYFLDGDKLIFRSDLPVEVSYRLIGRRFDWRKWPTRALDQTEKGMEVK